MPEQTKVHIVNALHAVQAMDEMFADVEDKSKKLKRVKIAVELKDVEDEEIVTTAEAERPVSLARYNEFCIKNTFMMQTIPTPSPDKRPVIVAVDFNDSDDVKTAIVVSSFIDHTNQLVVCGLESSTARIVHSPSPFTYITMCTSHVKALQARPNFENAHIIVVVAGGIGMADGWLQKAIKDDPSLAKVEFLNLSRAMKSTGQSPYQRRLSAFRSMRKRISDGHFRFASSITSVGPRPSDFVKAMMREDLATYDYNVPAGQLTLIYPLHMIEWTLYVLAGSNEASTSSQAAYGLMST